VIWEGEARQLRLSATQAIALLEYLRADDAWQQQRIVVGEHTRRFVLRKPNSEPEVAPESETAPVNQMSLSRSRTKALLSLLERHESWLREISEEEEAEAAKTRHKVYSYLLRLATRCKSREESGTGDTAA
jgi:hypothetical protein